MSAKRWIVGLLECRAPRRTKTSITLDQENMRADFARAVPRAVRYPLFGRGTISALCGDRIKCLAVHCEESTCSIWNFWLNMVSNQPRALLIGITYQRKDIVNITAGGGLCKTKSCQAKTPCIVPLWRCGYLRSMADDYDTRRRVCTRPS